VEFIAGLHPTLPPVAHAPPGLAFGPSGARSSNMASCRLRLVPTQDFMLRRLREIDGVEVAEVAGAFYVLPNMQAYVGDGAHADKFGDVPDVDALCRRALAALDMQCPSVPSVQ